MERNASPAEYDRAFSGLDFPAPRDAIVRAASDKGGLDNEVLFVLEQLPQGSYETRHELDSAVNDVYARTGGLAGGDPAAPANGQQPDPRAAASTPKP